jgi:hypothetical protein
MRDNSVSIKLLEKNFQNDCVLPVAYFLIALKAFKGKAKLSLSNQENFVPGIWLGESLKFVNPLLSSYYKCTLSFVRRNL